MFNVVFEASASLFQSCLSVWFVSRFNRRSYFGNKLATLFSAILAVLTICGDYLYPGFSSLSALVPFSTVLIYAIIICGGAYARAILSACLDQTLIMISSVSTYALISSIVNDFETTIQGSDSVTRYVYVVFANLCTFVILRLILSFFNVDSTLDIKTALIMFATSLLTMVGFGVTTDFAVKYQHDGIDGMIILLTCVFVAINVMLYTLVGQIQRLQRKKYELQLINEKLSFEESRIDDANAMLEACRKIRHDMKQHLTVIDGYLDDGKADECRDYVKKLYSSIDKTGNIIQSGNTVIDYLVSAKLGRLEDTQVIVSGNIGSLSDISDVDLSCMIGNILDNAVEATRPLKEKRIELTFATQGENRIIICRNTVGESVGNGMASTKPNPKEHGLGHKIVASVVESCDGMLSYFEEDGMFGVQIVLPGKGENG